MFKRVRFRIVDILVVMFLVAGALSLYRFVDSDRFVDPSSWASQPLIKEATGTHLFVGGRLDSQWLEVRDCDDLVSKVSHRDPGRSDTAFQQDYLRTQFSINGTTHDVFLMKGIDAEKIHDSVVRQILNGSPDGYLAQSE